MNYNITIVKQDGGKDIHLTLICVSFEFAKKILFLIEPVAYDLIKGYHDSSYSINAKMPYTKQLEAALLDLIRPGHPTL